MKKVRVIHFELDKNIGGIEIFLLNLYKQIDREKVQFEFVTTVDHAALEEQFISLGGIVHHVPKYKNIIGYCQNIERLLQRNVDFVHIHKNSAANVIPLVIAKKCGVKNIIVHSHNTAPSVGKASRFLHRLNKKYLNEVATKKFACSAAAGKWLYLDDDFEIVPNGIITDDYQFDNNLRIKKRKELFIDDNIKLIGNVGRFTTQKNQMRAVDIFETIHRIDHNTKLVLIGDGELKDSVLIYVQEKKMEKDILLLGVRHDIPELMMAMDAFIMPSLYEGLPIVAIEAQTAGLPLFLSDTISEEAEITDGVNWFSLADSDEKIANDIMMSMQTMHLDRNRLRTQVIDKGYDMKNTAMKMLSYYLS